MSFDSPDEKYGDGRNAFLNKFYNADVQFSDFMEKYENSDLSKDTLIIFTGDHCTYADDEYHANYTDTVRVAQLDEIPLFFYYPGIVPEMIDAEGRNTLDLAPTLMDYLDIDEKNYFFGDSLFLGLGDVGNDYDTVFTDTAEMYSSRNGTVSEIEGKQQEIISNNIMRYYGAARYKEIICNEIPIKSIQA